ncbi:MAG TPA: mechanosensitive ion channel domain-containing protein [Gammaproteobacteria bacterium]|nr:mechanosensitive ion channel domain-containing protein [Gammaproteobacteria bacterium]
MTRRTLFNPRLCLLLLLVGAGTQGLPAFAQNAATMAPAVSAAVADQAEAQQLAARRQAIEQEQAAVARERDELETLRKQTTQKLKSLDIGQIYNSMVEQADLGVDAERVNLGGIEVDLQSAEHQVANLQATIEALQQRINELQKPSPTPPAQDELVKASNELALNQAFLELENQHVANLRAARYITSQRLELAQQWAQELRSQYKTARELSDKAALGSLQARIQKEQQELLARAADLRKRLDTLSGEDAARPALVARLQQTEELARMKQIELALVQSQGKLNDLEAILAKEDAGTDELAGTLRQADALLRELAARSEFVQRKVALAKEQQGVIIKRLGAPAAERSQAIQDSRALEQVLATLDKHAKQLAFLTEKAQDRRGKLQEKYQQSLRHNLTLRQILPDDTATWHSLGQELLALPSALWLFLTIPLDAAIQQSGAVGLAVLLAIEAAWLGLILWLARYLTQALAKISPATRSFFVSLLLLAAHLLRTNIVSIAVIGALFIVFALAGMPQPGTLIFIILAWAWLIYKAAIDLAQLLLLDPQISRGGTHPRLYRALRWGILVISVIAPLMLLSHITSISPLLRNLIDRLFMLLLAPALILILHGRQLILSPLSSVLSARWLQATERIIIILSLALLVSVSIGLLGYVNLAWTIGENVGLFLLVLGGWLMVRGLLRDLFRVLKVYTAARAYGVAGQRHFLESLMDPLQRLAQLVLFLAAGWLLFRLYGWGADSAVVRNARAVLFSPLFHIDGKPIHLLGILLTILIVIAVLRIGRWTRELTYRWLFFKISNSGARHSLSVFTQYFVVLIGFLIALRVLGLDLTTLTVFAGALGVGIGFGLQNIANNFVSGILLLIERPVRTGDIVTIGTSEGTVTRIGIRSLTVKTPDDREVIIPNSEVISHPFTNWTFSDTIVRTSLSIGISYQNDVYLAKRLIEEILQQQPSVAKTTQSNVWLEDFASPAIILRVQYFTDVCGHDLQAVKSELLLQIWDSFKKAGIRFPASPPEPAPSPPAPQGPPPAQRDPAAK